MGEDRVAVVVDSAASLPADAVPGDDTRLYVVPMQLTLEGRTYLDGRDITPGAFYRMLRRVKGPSTTSAPSPESFLDAFRSAARLASSVLCLTVSPNFSSTFSSASTAVQEAKEALPNVEIALMDTESAAGGEGLVATEALRAARRGAGLQEVIDASRDVVPRVSLLAILDTLYYVWKSGRVPRIAYAGTSLLQIKPVLELHRGQVRNVARPRTTPRAIDKMLERMRSQLKPGLVHAAVIHADAVQAADELRLRVESEFPCEELYVSEFSPVMGKHTGPGLLGIAFWSEATGEQP